MPLDGKLDQPQQAQPAASRRQQMDALKREMEEERQRLYAQLDKEAQQARQQAQTMVERVKSQTDLLLNEMEEMKKQQQAMWEDLDLEEHMAIYEKKGMARKDAMKAVAKDRGISKREVYQGLL